MLDLLFSFTDPILDTDESDMFPFLVNWCLDYPTKKQPSVAESC